MEEQSILALEVERQDDAVVVRPHGTVAELEAQQLARQIYDQIDRDVVRIVVDLSDVTFLTSTCLGAFMAGHKRCRGSETTDGSRLAGRGETCRTDRNG